MSLKVIELFSGIGAPAMALRNNNINYQSIGVSEIDKFAIEAYNLIHGETKNFGDITKIEELPYCDFLHASTPCQSFSNAGKREGIKGESGLIYEFYRLMENYCERDLKPKFISYENVPELKTNFEDVYNELIENIEKWGYNVYSSILNAVNYNNPTKRSRLFIIGIRKDIDDNSFKMPTEQNFTKLTISSFLQESREETFRDGYIFHKAKGERKNPGQYIGYLEFGVNRPNQSNKVYDKNDICPTITANGSLFYIEIEERGTRRYRALYEQELWQIMGFSIEDYLKVKGHFSRNRIIHFIGNSIALGPLEAIYKNLKPLIEKGCY